VRGAGRSNKSSSSELYGPSQFLDYHPAFAGAVRLTTLARPIPESDESATAQTIGVMAELVREDSTAPSIRRATAAAIAGTPRDQENVAAAIHRWVREHVRFVQDSSLAGFSPDPDAAEVLVRPIDLLSMPQPEGDCDDFSMLAAAMLRSAGIRSAFKTVAADATSPDYSHVYVVTLLPSGAKALDASHGPYFGWEAPATGKARVWAIDKETMKSNLHGLGDTNLYDVWGGYDPSPTAVDQYIAANTPPAGGSSWDWSSFDNVLNTGIKSASAILGTRYGVPQLNSGQYIQTKNGVMYQQPAGAASSLPLGLGTPGGNGMLYVVAGLAVVAFLVTKGRA
jgi:hypothetical protein